MHKRQIDIRVRSQMQGGFLGLCLGDAMGSEWEFRTRAQILMETDGRGVTNFSSPLVRRPEAPSETCEPTDDTQLAFALARSLWRCQGTDLVDIARELVHEFRLTRFGWGGTTRDAAIAFEEWFDSHGKRGRDPRIACPPATRPDRGYGTGVAMKIAPLALWHLAQGLRDPSYAINLSSLMNETLQIGAMTHSDPRASHAAGVLAAAIAFGAKTRGWLWVDEPLAFLRALQTLISPFEVASLSEEVLHSGTTMSSCLERVARTSGMSADELSQLFPNTFQAQDAVGLSLAIMMRHPQDYRTAVLEAVNNGGDTDTIASMVGAGIGASVGLEGIPEEWHAHHPVCQTALELGARWASLVPIPN